MAIAQAQVGTSIGTIYTSTNNSATTVIFFCNTTGSAATVSAYAVASGGTAGAYVWRCWVQDGPKMGSSGV